MASISIMLKPVMTGELTLLYQVLVLLVEVRLYAHRNDSAMSTVRQYNTLLVPGTVPGTEWSSTVPEKYEYTAIEEFFYSSTRQYQYLVPGRGNSGPRLEIDPISCDRIIGPCIYETMKHRGTSMGKLRVRPYGVTHYD